LIFFQKLSAGQSGAYGSEPADDPSLDTALLVAIFLAATFAAALVAGLASIALGRLALYSLDAPKGDAHHLVRFDRSRLFRVETAPCDQLRRIIPYVIGAAVGVPCELFALSTASPPVLRIGGGAVLILYSLCGLLRPPRSQSRAVARWPMPQRASSMHAELCGWFTGIVATIRSLLRGWPKDQQRAVCQPVGVATLSAA
jgi:hypothetical protein